MAPGRKSPAAHASATPLGTVAKGLDGATWVVSAASNGVKRWVPVPPSGPSDKKYFVDDNGRVPFLVSYGKDKVSVFKQNAGLDEYEVMMLPKKQQIALYGVKVLKPTPYARAFVGKDPTNPNFTGNSMLFDLGGNKYLFVGEKVFTFRPSSPIKKYVSPVGNSNVPYPYAVDSEGRSYLMIDEVVLARDLLESPSQDPYEALAAMKKSDYKKYRVEHAMKTAIVHKRIN